MPEEECKEMAGMGFRKSGLGRASPSQGRRPGRVNWFIPAHTTGASTPIATEGRVVFCAWNNLGEPDQVAPWPAFPDLLTKYDTNHDGVLSRQEFPLSLSVVTRPGLDKNLGGDVPFSRVWEMFDTNKDNAISLEEYNGAVAGTSAYLKSNTHGITAVNLGPDGRPTRTGIAWKIERGVPEVPSPVAYQGKVYFIRNGGLLTCADAVSGKVFYDERIGVGGPYFASPIVAGGEIVIEAGEGVVAVASPGEELRIPAGNRLNEPIYASPAVAGNKLLIRTAGHLYAFESSRPSK